MSRAIHGRRRPNMLMGPWLNLLLEISMYVSLPAALVGGAYLALPTPADPAPTKNDGTVSWQYLGVINHGVTLIGWDDNKGAWLIKNSWALAGAKPVATALRGLHVDIL